MGKGSLNDLGGLQLYVWFDLGLDGGDDALSTWQRAFEKYSRALYRATYGKVYLEKIIYSNGFEIENMDVYINTIDQRPGTSGTLGGSGEIMMSIYDQEFPGTFLHELGHYLFLLSDEYENRRTFVPACNSGDTDVNVCIMCYGKYGKDNLPDSYNEAEDKYTVNDYCRLCNHVDPEGETITPCWSTISGLPYGLEIPLTFGTTFKPADAPTLSWEAAAKPSLYCLHDLGPDAQAGLHEDWLPSLLDRLQTHLGLSKNDLDLVLVDHQGKLQSIDENTTIDNLLALIPPVADQRRLAALQFPGLEKGAAASPGILAVTDRQIDGQSSEAHAKLLRQAGATVKAVYRGPVSHADYWYKLSSATIGDFRWAPATGSEELQNFVLVQCLTDATMASLVDFQLIHREVGALPNIPHVDAKDKLNKSDPHVEKASLRNRLVDAAQKPWHVDIPFLVEQGADQVAVIFLTPPDGKLKLRLENPSGAKLSKRNRKVKWTSTPYETLLQAIVDQPAHGRWIARIERTDASDAGPYCLQVWSNNRNIKTNFGIQLHGDGKGFDVRAFVGGKIPLAKTERPQISVWRMDDQGLPLPDSRRDLLLDHLEPGDERFFVHKPAPNGQFVGTVSNLKPGVYGILLHVSNAGTAVPARIHCLDFDEPEDSSVPFIPAFVRQAYKQIVIA